MREQVGKACVLVAWGGEDYRWIVEQETRQQDLLGAVVKVEKS